MARLRLVFMGTPEFAVPALEALIAAGHEIVCAYTQPPRPAGRKGRLTRSAVHDAAEAHGIVVRTPVRLKAPEDQAAFAALGADAALVAAYGLILPKPVLAAPRLGCVNIHASLLPRWRGASPIQHAILAGDAETGITIMQMDEGLDTGPILMQDRLPIPPTATAAGLHDLLAWMGARLIVPALDGLARGTLKPRPQPAEGATYAPRLTREDGALDFTRPAEEVYRRVRAFDPWPGAWFVHGGERIKVLAAGLVPDAEAAPGTVLADPQFGALVIACGEGGLRVTHLQREGKPARDAADFLRGYPLPPGTRFG